MAGGGDAGAQKGEIEMKSIPKREGTPDIACSDLLGVMAEPQNRSGNGLGLASNKVCNGLYAVTRFYPSISKFLASLSECRECFHHWAGNDPDYISFLEEKINQWQAAGRLELYWPQWALEIPSDPIQRKETQQIQKCS